MAHLQKSDSEAAGSQFRLARSGAAALPHVLAERMAEAFGPHTLVLPTYSMTECMPIVSLRALFHRFW